MFIKSGLKASSCFTHMKLLAIGTIGAYVAPQSQAGKISTFLICPQISIIFPHFFTNFPNFVLILLCHQQVPYLSHIYDPLLTTPTSSDCQNRRVDEVPSF